jgi:hypothetical protein
MATTPTGNEAAAKPDASEPKTTPRKYDPRKSVEVYNTATGDKLPRPVPETWLDGRFPQLSLTPSSKKAGK